MSNLVFNFKSKKIKNIKNPKFILGGKGANLAQMGKLGLPVPPGFTISTGVCEIFLAWHSTPSTSDEYWDRAKTFLDRAISIAPTKYEPREEYAYFQLNLAYYMVGKGDLEGAYREAVGAAKKFKAVPDYFVDGAPRGHRVAEGVRSTEKLLKRLKNT